MSKKGFRFGRRGLIKAAMAETTAIAATGDTDPNAPSLSDKDRELIQQGELDDIRTAYKALMKAHNNYKEEIGFLDAPLVVTQNNRNHFVRHIRRKHKAIGSAQTQLTMLLTNYNNTYHVAVTGANLLTEQEKIDKSNTYWWDIAHALGGSESDESVLNQPLETTLPFNPAPPPEPTIIQKARRLDQLKTTVTNLVNRMPQMSDQQDGYTAVRHALENLLHTTTDGESNTASISEISNALSNLTPDQILSEPTATATTPEPATQTNPLLEQTEQVHNPLQHLLDKRSFFPLSTDKATAKQKINVLNDIVIPTTPLDANHIETQGIHRRVKTKYHYTLPYQHQEEIPVYGIHVSTEQRSTIERFIKEKSATAQVLGLGEVHPQNIRHP